MFRSVYCCATIVAVVNSLQMEDPAATATAAAEHLARPEARAETASWAHSASHSDSDSRSDSAAWSQSSSENAQKQACEAVGFGLTANKPGGMFSFQTFE